MSPAEASYGGLSSLQQQTREKFRDVRRKLDAIISEYPDFGATVRHSLDTVRRALDEFGGSTGGEGLAISFNGGKDACVVLYLLLLVLSERDQLELLTNQVTSRSVRVTRYFLLSISAGQCMMGLYGVGSISLMFLKFRILQNVIDMRYSPLEL